MKTFTPHIGLHGSLRTLVLLVSMSLVAASAATPSSSGAGLSAARPAGKTLVVTITYVAHDGLNRQATVLLPAGYRPGANPPLPLVISPHGRGGTGRSNARFWGDLPTTGHFAVVNPDGMGRRLGAFSYGYVGQIDDLARMPQIVTRALPWVRLDRSRIYALGSSMGGQETLLLVARHPRLLAGAAAMDSVTDLALRYQQAPGVRTSPEFLKRWGSTVGACLQSAMQREVGGTPATTPRAFAARSPLSLATAIARSGVPLQIWWSRVDRIVINQKTQSGALYRTLRRLGTQAPVRAYIGRWAHSTEMRSTSMLPIALSRFGLLPRGFERCPAGVVRLSTRGQ
jgi:pimeloyl-ACP methyl ester carboxylesterase